MARRATALLWAALVLALAACSGGGGGGTGVRIVAASPGGGAATATSGTTGGATNGSTAPPTASASAAPTTVPLPTPPADPFAGGLAVSAYLAGGHPDMAQCLPNLVKAWNLAPVTGPRCLAVDLDGDGLKEFVFLVTVAGTPQPAGDVWFFDDAKTGYRFFSSARALANQVLSGVRLIGTADLTGDGKPEVVITDQQCSSTTAGAPCATGVIVASEHTGTLTDLAPKNSALVATTSVKIAPAQGGNLAEVVMTSDPSAAPGPGPQPGLTRDLAWNGIGLTVQDTPGTPVYLINVVDNADAAFRAGDLTKARRLYDQAATDPTLKDWKADTGTFAGRREIVPYAFFRAALVAERQGDSVAVRQLLTQASTGHTNSMLGIAAATYLTALNAGQSPEQACSAAKQYLTPFANAYAKFWDYGYANPEHTIADLC